MSFADIDGTVFAVLGYLHIVRWANIVFSGTHLAD